MTAEEREQVKLDVGDRVTSLADGRKGTVTRLGRFGECVQVRWDKSLQELTPIANLKKE